MLICSTDIADHTAWQESGQTYYVKSDNRSQSWQLFQARGQWLKCKSSGMECPFNTVYFTPVTTHRRPQGISEVISPNQRVIISQSVLAYKQSGKSQAMPESNVETPNHQCVLDLSKSRSAFKHSTTNWSKDRKNTNIYFVLFVCF